MERYVTLIGSATADADREWEDCPARVAQIVEAVGGKPEGMWELEGGPYRFVAVTLYPDHASAAKARAGIEALGIATLEGYPVEEMPDCLRAMAA